MEETDQHTGAPFPQKKRKLLETNRILSLTAIFVSVCTLFILVYQTHLSNKMYYLEEKALKASAMPILQMRVSFGADYFDLELENVGIGPAKIQSIHVLYQDSIYAMDVPTAIRWWYFLNPNVAEEEQITNYTYSNIVPNQVISINDKTQLISANDRDAATKLQKLFFLTAEGRKINLAITYTSIYEDETWTAYLFDPFTIPSESELAQYPWEASEEYAEPTLE